MCVCVCMCVCPYGVYLCACGVCVYVCVHKNVCGPVRRDLCANPLVQVA